jgi:hypothetical protein
VTAPTVRGAVGCLAGRRARRQAQPVRLPEELGGGGVGPLGQSLVGEEITVATVPKTRLGIAGDRPHRGTHHQPGVVAAVGSGNRGPEPAVADRQGAHHREAGVDALNVPEGPICMATVDSSSAGLDSLSRSR